MAENNQEAVATVASSGGSGSKVVMIVSIVNMMATLGVIGVLLMAHQKEASKPTVEDIVSSKGGGHAGASEKDAHGNPKGDGHGAEASAVTDAGKIVALEPFTVNLTTGVGTYPRYVRMNVSVELETGAMEKEFEVKLPRVRDTVINLLNSKKASEVNAVDGREQLKAEIKRSINAFLLQSKVKGVYFTNFAISN